ncbi:lipopolysaccharide biosynthesis protein [Roseateles sp. DAIF2]|nr:lipopolysaccharide biosynthesis protein [Roseateles sp. DAIF2]
MLTVLARRWRLLVAAPLTVGVLALGISYLIKPTFTARTSFLPPQQQQSAAASALASLGALAGLAGGSASMKTPGDQYVALMQSTNVEDRIVDRFKLMELYKAEYRFEARTRLEQNVRIGLGKKDGLITIEVDDTNPALAADIANQYVTELRRLSSELALTEAQQRRTFFEGELKTTRSKLTQAQQALQSGGFNAGALKAEPKAAAENYARLKAEFTSAEVRLQTLRRALTETSPEVQHQATMTSALRSQLARLETREDSSTNADYVGRYREFKYQEALFELFSKQYEIARLDESRESTMIQVIDVATPPEHKSRPKRGAIAVVATISTLLILMIYVLSKHFWDQAKKNPANAERIKQLRGAWGSKP